MMNRRRFLKSATAVAAATITYDLTAFAKAQDATVGASTNTFGQGDWKFKLVPSWGVLDPKKYPVRDLHEIVQTKNGDIYIVGNHTDNCLFVYRAGGTLVRTFGDDYDGGHGLTLSEENGEEFLWVSNASGKNPFVRKINLKGETIMELGRPDCPEYANKEARFVPTEVEINPANGDIYVADGYGSSLLTRYDKTGKLIDCYGADQNFKTMHGVRLDTRDPKNPCLWVTNRSRNRLHKMSLDGKTMQELYFPGAWPCRVSFAEGCALVTVIWANSEGGKSQNTGFVMVLGEDDKPVSLIGGLPPQEGEKFYRRNPELKTPFLNPHDSMIDADGNLIVAQWASEKTYPLKFERVRA